MILLHRLHRRMNQAARQIANRNNCRFTLLLVHITDEHPFRKKPEICAGGCIRSYADPLPHCDGCTFRERS